MAVIGGGIAGLAAAWELSGEGGEKTASGTIKVVVFESGSSFGGKLKTAPFGGREVDLGPDAFVARRPEALALCRELGLEGELVAPGTRRAYVWARGRLRPLPAGLALGVPTRFGPLARSGICSPAGLLGPALDLLRPSPRPGASGAGTSTESDRAVGQIVRRRLGSEVTAMLAGPLIGGIHAGSVDALSAAAVFPALLEADRQSGSLMKALRATLPGPTAGASDGPVFLSPRGGMGRLVETLTGALAERGVDLHRQTAVLGLARDDGRWTIGTEGAEFGTDGVVVALPTPAAAGLLEGHVPSLGSSLRSISYSSVALLTFRFERKAVRRALDGSGFLVPRGAGGDDDPLLTACTWLSAKWPELDRGDDVLLRVSVGRAGDSRHEDLDDDELIGRCLAELGPMMGGLGSPTDSLVTRWPLAFPQYAVGHLALVRAIEADAATLPGLALAGAALHGVGIPACIGSGRRAARTVLRAL